MRTHALAVTLLMLPALAAANDGTAAAARDKEAKARQGKEAPRKPVKVYTDEDLKKARESESGNVTVLHDNSGRARTEGAEGEAAPAAETAAPAAELARDETSWRSAAAVRWADVRSNEERIRELDQRILDLNLDRDPSPSDLLDPSRLQKRDAAKVQAQKDLEAAQAQLQAARQALEDFQAKGRTAGVPPAWLEEPAPQP